MAYFVYAVRPFAQLQLAKPEVHTVFTSYDVVGAPHNLNVIYTTAKFREQNPKSYAAFIAAFKEATLKISLLAGDRPEPAGGCRRLSTTVAALPSSSMTW